MSKNNNQQGYRNNPKLKPPGVELPYTEEQLREYVKCANDPVYFCSKYVKVKTLDKGVMPFELYDYQQKFVNEIHKNRFVISKWPRQSGKSTSVIGYITHYVTFNQSVSCAILANKLKTAKDELFAKLQLAYENLPHFLQQGVVEWNKTSFKLENGSRVVCDATSSSAIRGGSYNLLLLDEYAFLPSHIAEEFYSSTYPTISAGLTTKLIIVSTPNGMNHFHKLWVDANRPEGHKLKNKFVPVEVSWRDVPITPGDQNVMMSGRQNKLPTQAQNNLNKSMAAVSWVHLIL
jgi:ribosomal protein S17E